MVIEEVPGENYVVIDRSPESYWNRPINQTYKRSITPEIDKIIISRVLAMEELKKMLLSHLPELEEAVGLKYWCTLPGFDEDPPALYIGLYKPTVEQMKAVVKLIGNTAKSKGILIKFYEAYAHIGIESKLNESWYKLIGKYNITNPPITATSGNNDLGLLKVYIEYNGVKLSRELIIEMTKSIREIIGYDVPLLLYLIREPLIAPVSLMNSINMSIMDNANTTNKSSILNMHTVTSMELTNTLNIAETNAFNELNTIIATIIIVILILMVSYLALRIMKNHLLRRKSGE